VLRLRVLGPLLLGVLALAVPTALADLAGEKEGVDARIEQLRAEIEEAKRHETVLTSDIAAASERIRIVEGEVDLLAGKVAALELELARHRARLAELRERYREQTRRLTLLEDAERTAVRRLEERLVDLYENEPPDGIEVLLLSRSLNDLISQLEYLDQIAREDRRIAEAVEQARAAVAAARHQTEATRAREAEVTATLAARTAERREALERLVARRNQLVSAQADREALLTAVRESRHEAAEDLEVLERESAELAARIRAAQSRSTAAPAVSSSGFLWPVSGPITSPFGMRWGRLHAGIDIGAAFGTTISVAAGGTVIYAGWLGGYGNLVVVDHGGGLATAYAHQQAIYVGVGQSVGRGEALGEVGSTGNSTGPHLHFEVRVNGSPVDPLGYL
jgi:murein DD-endopeptidase MepM/ murein hydrolase activator NlpD